MAGGRPSKLTPELMQKAQNYLSEYESAIPSVAGLSLYLDVSRSTIYNWSEEDGEFLDILEKILATQEQKVLSNGLTGDYNATIAKLVLGKHGYTDRQETNHGLTNPVQDLVDRISGNTLGPK